MKKSLVTGAALAALLFCSCIYYNILYNAQKAFREARQSQLQRYKDNPDSAETVTAAEKEKYQKAVIKASKALELYPAAREWIDDAVFLLGQTFYYQGENESAIRKFLELLTRYPESKFREPSLFYLGMSYFRNEQYPDAKETFDQLYKEGKETKWARLAGYMLSEVALVRGSKLDAIDYLEKNLKENKHSYIYSLLHFKVGKVLQEAGEYERAIDRLGAVQDLATPLEYRELNVPASLWYLSQIKIGECYESIRQPQRALAQYEALAQNQKYYKFRDENYLRMGRAYAAMDSVARAEAVFQQVLVLHPNDNLAATANYILGELYENRIGDFEKAARFYNKSKDQGPAGGIREKAKTRLASIALLRELRGLPALTLAETQDLRPGGEKKGPGLNFNPDSLARKKSADSLSRVLDTSALKNAADSLRLDSLRGRGNAKIKNAAPTDKWGPTERVFLVGEIFLFELGHPDSAEAAFDSLLKDTVRDSFDLKALYGKGWILQNIKKDTTAAIKAFREVVARYPSTEEAKASQKAIGEEVTQKTRQDSVHAIFQEGERYYREEQDYPRAIDIFTRMAGAYPQNPLAGKALFNAAWIQENLMNENPKALATYKIILDSFPKSEYAGLAKMKIDGAADGQVDLDLSKINRPRLIRVAGVEKLEGNLKMELTWSEAAIIAEMEKALKELNEDFQKKQAKNKDLKGPWEVEFTIDDEGSVIDIAITKTSFKDSEIDEYLQENLTAMEFESNDEGNSLKIRAEIEFKGLPDK
jgi:TolA-binding protein